MEFGTFWPRKVVSAMGPNTQKQAPPLKNLQTYFFLCHQCIDQEVPGCFLFMRDCYVMQYMVLFESLKSLCPLVDCLPEIGLCCVAIVGPCVDIRYFQSHWPNSVPTHDVPCRRKKKSWERYAIPPGQTNGSHQLSQMFFGLLGFYHKTYKDIQAHHQIIYFTRCSWQNLFGKSIRFPTNQKWTSQVPSLPKHVDKFQIILAMSHHFPYWKWSAQVSVPLGCANFVWTALRPSALAMAQTPRRA